MTRHRGWWIIFVAWLALMLNGGATTFLFNLLVGPMEGDLGWSRSTIYGVLTVSAVIASLLSALMGPLFDKHGGRMLMTISAIVAGISFGLVSQVQVPWHYYLCIGLGVAISRPALQNLGPRTVISNWFIRKRPLAFGIYSTGNPAAGVALVAPFSWLIANFGWRWVWACIGGVQLFVVSPLAWLIVRRRPEDVGLEPDGEPAPPRSATDPPAVPRAVPEDAWTQSLALRTSTFWRLVVGSLLISFPGSTIFLHMVPYMQLQGMSAAMAATSLSGYALAAVAGRPVWGYIIARFGVHRAQTLFALCYGTAISAFLLANPGISLTVATFTLGMVIGGLGQLQAQIWPDYFGRRIVGTLTGYVTILTMPSMAGGPWLAAIVYDRTGGYDTLFSLFAVFCFIASLFFFLAKRPTPPGVAALAA